MIRDYPDDILKHLRRYRDKIYGHAISDREWKVCGPYWADDVGWLIKMGTPLEEWRTLETKGESNAATKRP